MMDDKTPQTLEDCFPELDLGIPAQCVFYFAEVSADGRQPLSNKRWSVLEDGEVWYSKNKSPFQFNTASTPVKLFNTPLKKAAVHAVPLKKLQDFLAFVQQKGFFEFETIIETPSNLKVKGGADYYMEAHYQQKTGCTQFGPETPHREAIREAFRALLVPSP